MSGPRNMPFTDTPVTVPSSTPVLAIGWNPIRSYLAIQNTGVGSLSISFNGSSAARAGTGLSLDPASGPGGQGGSFEFTDAVAQNSVWLYSAAGTTAYVLEAT